MNESIWLDQNLYSRLLQPNATGTGLLPDLATSWNDQQGRPDLHLPPAQRQVLRRLPGDRERRRVLDRPVTRVQGRLGLPAHAGEDHHGPRSAHGRHHAVAAKHAPLLADLAMYAYSIVPKQLVQAQGKAFFQHPVGSGPFYVTSYKPDSEVDLARNPHFYGTKPKISKVKILDRAQRQHPRAHAGEQEGRRHREPAGQPDQPDRQDARPARATSSRPPGSTSSSWTSTSGRSRSSRCGRR